MITPEKTCPYGVKAKELLEEKGLEFEQIHDWCDVDNTETND